MVEVIKELFPNIEFKENKVHKKVYGMDSNGNEPLAMLEMAFNMNWLNKEYRRGE